MLTQLKQFAKRSNLAVIFYHVYDNWRAERRFKSGEIETSSGSIHSTFTLSESLSYINQVFDDYLTYSGISTNMLQGKRILEIGPGDNSVVALKFLVAGARQVVCLDKFFLKRDWEQQRKIYQASREQLSDSEKRIFDGIIDLTDGFASDSEKLLHIYGTGIEEAERVLEPGSFDLIVSRAVFEHLYDTDAAFSVMNKLLVPGGYMIHKIDFRDHGMFFGKHHPLTFLTVPDAVYKLMTYDSGKPNRRLINYYRRKTRELGYDTKLFITQIVGVGSEIIPHKEAVMLGVDYSDSTISLLKQIRPHLQPEFREMSSEDLLVSGIFLVARKPCGVGTQLASTQTGQRDLQL